MVEITYQMVLSTLQTVGILVGIFYYIMTLRNTTRNQELTRKSQEQALETRQAQLFMQIYDRWLDYPRGKETSVVMHEWEWDDPEDFWRKYGPENHLEYIKWTSHSGFLEGIGVLIKRGYIDPYLVDDLMSLSAISYWERFGEVIQYGRKRYNWPQLWEYCEYLHDQIKQIAEQQHPELKT